LSAEERGAFSGAVVDVGASDAKLEFRLGKGCSLLDLARDAIASSGGSAMVAEVTSGKWIDLVFQQCDLATIQSMASGSVPAFDMRLRERAGATHKELGTLTEIVGFGDRGSALVFTGAGEPRVARVAPDAAASAGGGATNASDLTGIGGVLDTKELVERVCMSNVLSEKEIPAGVPRTSDEGAVTRCGRTIRESALSLSTTRAFFDRDGKPTVYAPRQGEALWTQWWFWLVIALGALVLVGGAAFAFRGGERVQRRAER
jgi:hypothetical protein